MCVKLTWSAPNSPGEGIRGTSPSTAIALETLETLDTLEPPDIETRPQNRGKTG